MRDAMDPKLLCAKMNNFSMRKLFLALTALATLGIVVGVWSSLSPNSREQQPLPPIKKQLARIKKQCGQSEKCRIIIADVNAGLCGQLQAPPEWPVLYAGQAAKPNHMERLNGKRTHTFEQLLYDPIFLQEKHEATFGLAWKKNVASLRAIAEGATQILVTDCSVSLTEALRVLHVQYHPDQGVMYNETNLFNPYAHFGAWALAPRAALSMGLWTNSRLYYVRDFNNVLLRHVLSDQSTDAVVMLPSTAGSTDGRRFDRSSPPVYVGQRSFSPVVSGCSLYHREALWALLDPCLSPSLHCPVVWTLLRQRLLRELDAFSGYFQTNSSHLNPQAHVSNKTLGSSTEGIHLSEVVTYLDSWECAVELPFFTCFRNLAHNLTTKGYVKKEENILMTTWVTALEKLGIEEPARAKSPWRGVRAVNEVRVTLGSVQTRLEQGGSGEEAYLSQQFISPVRNLCRDPLSSAHRFLNVSLWKDPLITDVVLIIVFNKYEFFWKNLYLLESTHRPYFKHIVYCVSDIDKIWHGDNKQVLSHVVLLEGLTEGWYLLYGCVTHVMEMNIPGVHGYMQIGDDVLYNSWRLLNESRDIMLWHESGEYLDITMTKSTWMHWAPSMGRCAILRALAGLEHISGLDNLQLLRTNNRSSGGWSKTFTHVLQDNPQLYQGFKCPLLPGSQDWPEPTKDQARRFMLNYYHVYKMAGKVWINGQDFLYVPQNVAADFVTMSRYFMKNRVILELAVYAIQIGLSKLEQRKAVQGTISWGEDRLQWENAPGLRYNVSHYYMHPFKMAALPQRKKVAEFFCKVHLKNLFMELVNARGRK